VPLNKFISLPSSLTIKTAFPLITGLLEVFNKMSHIIAPVIESVAANTPVRDPANIKSL